jgi:hypothetical protein
MLYEEAVLTKVLSSLVHSTLLLSMSNGDLHWLREQA